MAIKDTIKDTVLIGLGNPILSDDAVGLIIAQKIKARLPELQVFESLRGGFELLDMLRGYDRAFVIDAIVTKRADPGTLWELSLEDLPPSLTLATSHEVDLPTAFKLGQELGYELPSQVFIWAIEVADAYTVAEELSPEVEAVVEEAVEEIISKIAGSD